MSTLSLAMLPLVVVASIKVTQWKSGKKKKIDGSLPPVYTFPGNNLLLKFITVVGAILWLLMIYAFI
ncbi:Uncharacterised protein [Raoultella terrigena]|uniref:Uncharacterized protein n=1 Tax=Raoultella terrigena TaxID=577 RepID=A0A3P8JM35_RAOTE|nr:Uncharacterised protein [Raoultella terrigena]